MAKGCYHRVELLEKLLSEAIPILMAYSQEMSADVSLINRNPDIEFPATLRDRAQQNYDAAEALLTRIYAADVKPNLPPIRNKLSDTTTTKTNQP